MNNSAVATQREAFPEKEPTNAAAITIRDLTKTYTREQFKVTALDNINLTIPRGDFVALTSDFGNHHLIGSGTPSIGS
jgi:hypothetical protein